MFVISTGSKKCNVTVSTINWLEGAPGLKGLPRFVSVFNSDGEKEGSTDKAHQRVDKINAEPLMPILNASVGAMEKTTIITVDPAQHLVTHAGRCVCTDGELRCSRPGIVLSSFLKIVFETYPLKILQRYFF